jgi:hypothetical protein
VTVLWAGRTKPLRPATETESGETLTTNAELVALDVYEGRTDPSDAMNSLARLYEAQKIYAVLHALDYGVDREALMKRLSAITGR